MKVAVHLVSLPWAPVFQPSVALGCLKAYVDKYFNGKIKCYSYSAFFEVLVNALGVNFIKFCDPMYIWRSAETISQITYFDEFKNNNLNRIHRKDFIKQIRAEQKHFSHSVANKLRSSLINYIENHIVPNLEENSINIVGLSMCMQQCYLSAFLGKYLKQNHTDFNYVFLYGGSSTDSINVAQVFADEEIPGYFVIGEGESKLANIIETILKADSWSKEIEERIEQDTVGVLPISKRILLYERNKDFYKSQVNVDSLPDPDYQEYFDTARKFCKDPAAYCELMTEVRIPLEGTRGCFGKCDFCNNDIVWEGFRRFHPKRLLRNALNYTSKYNCNQILFVDNVCNTWAPIYADELISRNRRISTSMELRAQLPESFWTKLALSGTRSIQIGTEALSPILLKAIGKGTTVVQNIVVQKYLKELGIKSYSNIMADHPKSTIEDIKFTRHVITHLSHLDQYTITYFALVQGSPLYLSLNSKDRRKLKIGRIIPCKGKYDKLYISEFFELPKTWLPSHVKKAWTEFSDWHEKRKKKLLLEPERLDVIECSNDMLWIRKVSKGKQKDHKYDGRYAGVYKICHQGLSLEKICDQLNLAESEVITILNEFTADKLMIDIDGIFISLALRSRDVLINNFYQSN
jgi:radical SAM superfamily enzyme YgiQ (UPF0313 family)